MVKQSVFDPSKRMNKLDPAAYLSSLNVDVMRFGLKAISELLSQLGNPQNAYKTILIAGTNGKGSTAAMTASILHSAGYKTGLYTSPHLIDVRERITVNGKKISRQDFCQTVNNVRKQINQPLTYFEVLTATAFLYFQRQKVDIAVLEVGLGGRLDATNVCRPLVSIITNISFDHMAYLGNSLTSIAREKAGIIKRNGICITAAKQKKVLQALEIICRHHKSRFYHLGKDIKIKTQKNGLIAYHGLYNNLRNLTVPLPGRHQRDNAALALAAMEIIEEKGFPANEVSIKKGLKNTHWSARLEVLHNNPLFVLDGAHNLAGISALCRALKKEFIYRRLILIFSALADKDYQGMLRKIAPLAQRIILVQLQSKRAVPVADIYEYVKKMGCKAVIAENVADSISRALDLAGGKDMICAAGSLYLAGEIKHAFPEMASYDKKFELKSMTLAANKLSYV
jgi:dihydrofolate synthase / folylpolyglutamate synthase